MKIAFVVNDAWTVESLAKYFEAVGHSVRICCDTDELEKAMRDNCDLYIVDTYLAGMSWSTVSTTESQSATARAMEVVDQLLARGVSPKKIVFYATASTDEVVAYAKEKRIATIDIEIGVKRFERWLEHRFGHQPAKA